MVPVIASCHHGSGAGKALPGGDRRPSATVVDGGPGQPGEHVLTTEAALRESQGLQQYPAGDSSGQLHHRGAVGLNPGGGELFVDQPGVGVGTGMQDGDAVEPGALADCVDDRPDRGPHLFVGVRGRHEPGAVDFGNGVGVEDVGGFCLGAHPGERGRDLGVCPGVAGGGGDDGKWSVLGEAFDEAPGVAG